MFSKKIIYAMMVIMLVAGIILSGCGQSAPAPAPTPAPTPAPAPSPTPAPAPTPAPTPTPTPAPAPGGVETWGTFVMISPYAPSSFGYPPDTRGFAPVFAMQPCLEGFIDADLHGNLRPKLALSWVTAPDKSSITFTLRKGVKFHDGTDFHAQAAKWNFDNWIKQGTGVAAAFASVDVVDDYTIRINLKYYSNTILTSMNSLMISPTAVQKNGIDWAKTNPVGTGPFKMTKFVRDTEMDFVRFDDYWGDKARVNAMKFFYIVDATTARMAFQGGDGKVLEGAVPRTAFDLQALGFSVASRRGPLMNLIPDSKNADSPFSKLKVREAVEYAINRQSIANTLGYGWWEAVNQPDAPEQFGHIDKLVGRSYDPAKAKQLLAEAGFPNGFSTRIISQPALSQDSLVAIQSDLAAVGIIVALDVVSAAKWAEIRISGWDNGLFFVTHGATDFNYCAYLERYYGPKTTYYPVMQHPAGWDDLMNQMLKASEPDQMKALAQKAVQMHVDEAMAIPLWIEAECYVLDPRVHDAGYGTHGDGFGWDTNMVWISKEK